MLDSYPRSDGSKCPSNHNNIRRCCNSIQGPMDRSVHPTTTILEDVGFLSKLRWTKVSIQPYQYHRVLEYQYQRVLEFYPRPNGSKCPSNCNNINTCWISDPNNSSVPIQTYKSHDQTYTWRGAFSGWSSGSVSCRCLGVYGKDIGGRMIWEFWRENVHLFKNKTKTT